MKAVLPYIVITFVTLFLAVQCMLVAFIFKPELFFVAKQTAESQAEGAVHDSTQVSERVVVDSAALRTVRVLSDSINVLLGREEGSKRRIADLEQQVTALKETKAAQNKARIAQTAKLLSGMSAEQAAKILQSLPDAEAREVLPLISKRQVGRILGILDPQYAARLMKE